MRSAEFNEDRIVAFAERMKIEPEKVIAEQRAKRDAFMNDPAHAEAIKEADYRISLAIYAERLRKKSRMSKTAAASACRDVAMQIAG